MAFEIDEDKIKATQKPDSKLKGLLAKFDDSISNFLLKIYNFLKFLLILAVALGLIIFIGGSIIGFLKIGWNQL
jgi:hypothetical protein